MADVFKKKVLRVESASKNGKTWKVVFLEGKEPGTESKQNIFDAAVAAKITGPGEYMIKFAKNGQYWNIAEVVSGPVRGSTNGGGAPQGDALLQTIIAAAGSVYQGAGVKIEAQHTVVLEQCVAAMIKTLHAEVKAILNLKPEPTREKIQQQAPEDL